jgi:glycine/D-amino acid oxidase-like deaminating enzyme
MPKNPMNDVIIVGGGNIGSALAYGLVHLGLSVALLDEGNRAYRAAYGNFGLVWFQGKGVGNQRYVDYTLEATQKWSSFAALLEQRSGIRINYHKPGGLFICLGEAGLEERRLELQALAHQSPAGYDCEMIDRRQVEKLIPLMRLGPNVSGASYSRHDGHVNPLYLMRALHAAIQQAGGRYYPETTVTDIRPQKGAFLVETSKGSFSAAKLVLAAGVQIPSLAAKLGLRVPVRPQRGQLLVSERVHPMLPLPVSAAKEGDSCVAPGVRQTDEGTFMMGASNEEVGFDTHVNAAVLKRIASHAIEIFPGLAEIRVQRCWAALRPLAPDSLPIYQQCSQYPGAYIVTSHSAVTLSSQHADTVARWIFDGITVDDLDVFSLRRFNV